MKFTYYVDVNIKIFKKKKKYIYGRDKFCEICECKWERQWERCLKFLLNLKIEIC